MEIAYQRDLNKSYMVIQKTQIDWEEFEMRMIQQNQLKGLLEVFQVVQDLKLSFLYDISSMQSLDIYLQRKEVNRDFLEKLALSLKDLSDRLKDYLLDENALVLSLETIFIHQDQLKFVYLPGYHRSIGEGLQKLLEGMLSKVDSTDRRCVELTYRLYQKATEENFSMDEFLKELEMEEARAERPRRSIKTQVEEAEIPVQEEESPPPREKKSGKEKKKLFSMQSISKWLLKDEPNEEEENHTPLFGEYAFAGERIMSLEEEVSHPTIYSNLEKKVLGELKYQGHGRQQDYFLKKEKNFIGKQGDLDLVLDSESISRLHALICKEDGEYMLEDLNSTNGTYLNEKPLKYKEKVILKVGDEIRFGEEKYVFF